MKPRSVIDNEQPEELLFFRRWIANPLKVGALLPSAPALARLVARNVEIGPDDAVIEVGAGTGSITKALVSAGIPRERLFVIEIDADMCTYLRKQFPQVQIIHGDAGRLGDIVPSRWHGKVSTVVSGWIRPPGPGSPAVPSTDPVPVCAIGKIDAEVGFSGSAIPARTMPELMKQFLPTMWQVSPT